MKSHWLTLALTFILVCPAMAQDQMQLGKMASGNANQADKELNAIYQQVLKKYSTNKAFIAKLRQAELAWIKFRDQHTIAVFPEAQANPDQYGSAIDMCLSLIPAQQTAARTADLKKLIAGTQTHVVDTQNKFAKAEAQVNRLFQAALKKPHEEEPTFISKFRSAQSAWLAFRNADAEAWSMLANGAERDAVKMSRMLQLDESRARSLNEWVKGIPEGDVCTGSRVIEQ
ncbi:MAG: DUF1311 domain-containing protein [Candidatus Obscuribacterales bacterium]|nr:DUF1311 domain-containing protein [Candidatus Obscuribacterales bacterium]